MFRSLRPLKPYLLGSAAVLALCAAAWAAASAPPVAISDRWFDAIAQLAATLVGAGIALGATWTFEKKAARERKRTQAMSAMFKMMAIGNNLHSIRLLLDKALNEANEQRRTSTPLWLRIKPTTSVPAEVTFDPSEMEPFFGGTSNVPARLVLIAQRHNTVISTLILYNQTLRAQREHIRQLTDEGATVPPSVHLRGVELQELAVYLLQQTREFLQETVEVSKLFNAVSKRNDLRVVLTLGDYGEEA